MFAFDSISTGHLLSDKFKEFFGEKYPLFYKNKYSRSSSGASFYRNAVENALRMNQAKSVEKIIEFIVKYQNNFASSFLFNKNLPLLIQKGITVANLMSSNVFEFSFDFDEWPGIHSNMSKLVRPYNGSIFELRQNYKVVFPEVDFAPIPENIDSSKVYKIKYTINMMPICAEHVRADLPPGAPTEMINAGVSMSVILANTKELAIFKADGVKNFIMFRWASIGKKVHMLGFLFHGLYLLFLMYYINDVYINNYPQFPDIESEEPIPTNKDAIWLVFAILYPIIYEVVELYSSGAHNYFTKSINLNN